MKLFYSLLFLLMSVTTHANSYPFQNGVLEVPELGSKGPLKCSGCSLPTVPFITLKFNRPGDFHGPNCYNTALIGSGVMKSDQIRYVSPEEFEAILKTNYSLVNRPQAGDVVVMDAKASRGHAALYLGDNLIFHKKSFGTQYHYRITSLDLAGVVEKNEWIPSPIEGSINQFIWPELGTLPTAFYRPNKKLIPLDPKFSKVMKILEAQITQDLGQWAIAKKWGLVGMHLIEDYLNRVTSSADAITLGMLISFKDQLSLYFDELHYKNGRSYERTTEEICLPQDPHSLGILFQNLATSLNISKSQMETRWNEVMGQERKKCRVRFLK